MSFHAPPRAVRVHYLLVSLFLIAAVSACTARQEENTGAKAVQEPSRSTPATTAQVADPMASFASMVGGEWKTTAASGRSMFDTWHWGPGKHSMRVVTDGLAASGNPWRALQVMYWHPGRKEVRMLGLNPYNASVAEGSIKFDGKTADGVFDMYQSGVPPVRRKLNSRWTFDGPDKYQDSLLEAGGAAEYVPLAAWDRVRVAPRAQARPPAGEEASKVSEHLKVFQPFLGHTWNARGEVKADSRDGPGVAFHIETTFEWIPLASAIYARSFALRGNGEPTHVLDTYFYHHTGTDKLRCLALTNLGESGSGVYEGDVTVPDREGVEGSGGAALQLDLKGYVGERALSYIVRIDVEKEGTLHQRVWPLDAVTRDSTPMIDVHHAVSEMSKSILTVFQDRKGNYWFGSDVQGVYRYDGKSLRQFTGEDGLCNDRVRGIQEDKSGNMYFTTADGISKFDGQAFTTLIPVKGNPPDKEWRLDPDDLWFPAGQDAGVVYRYDGTILHCLEFPKTKLGDEHFARFPRSQFPNMRFNPYDVYSILKDSKGTLWFGTGTGRGALGVCRYDGKSFTWISSDELGFGDVALCVRSTAEDKDGKFWFSNTLNRFDVLPNDPASQVNSSVSIRKEKGVGRSDDRFAYFMSSAKDEIGDLWMATYGAGVWRYDGKNMTHYPVLEGGQPVTLYSIYKDNHGVLWLGTHESGAYRLSGKAFEKFKP
ncbi:MAG: hypothetical protein H7210_12610 [Pyrinomonadaceae bacterium]|nr:hypothetical protein [Phycisphaerales bacterium]